MSCNAEAELATAKAKFAATLDDFDPVTFIKKRPVAAAGIALTAGAAIGLLRFSKVKTLLLWSPVLGLMKKVISK